MTSRQSAYNPLREAEEAHEARRATNAHIRGRFSREFVSRVSNKLQAAAWVVGLVMLFVYGGLGDVMFDPVRSLP